MQKFFTGNKFCLLTRIFFLNIDNLIKKFIIQGLLQKDPTRRLTWPDLFNHPFVKNDILIMDEAPPMSLTTPLSASQALAKKQQLENLSMRSTSQSRVLEKTIKKIQEQKRCISQPRYPTTKGTDSPASVDLRLANLSLRASLDSHLMNNDDNLYNTNCHKTEWIRPITATITNFMAQQQKNYVNKINSAAEQKLGELQGFNYDYVDKESRLSRDYEQEFGTDGFVEKDGKLVNWEARDVNQHIENEEWLAFLQRSMEEVIDGEITSLVEKTCVSVFVSPLRNSAASCQVVEYVTCLLSLPFVVTITQEDLDKIQKVYFDVRVVPNLVYAMKLIMLERSKCEEGLATITSGHDTKSASMLSPDQLQALECSMLLLCRLVYVREEFMKQFCEAVYTVNGIPFLQQLFQLDKRKARVVADLLAILNNILRLQPEDAYLVENVVLGINDSRKIYPPLLFIYFFP